jgi:hypothetical protein
MNTFDLIQTKKMSINLRKATFAICVIACLGDIVITSIIGLFYPGYSHLRNTLSQMGASISPVSVVMSIWWIVDGLLFVLFGILFGKIYPNDKFSKMASWLIIAYGIGEGICSGLFPVDYSSNSINIASEIHIVLSGLGVLALLLLPFVFQKVFDKHLYPKFFRLSYFAFFAGLLFMVLFSVAKMYDFTDNFFAQYKGLWQRLITLNFYVYFLVLALIILKQEKKV